MLLGVHCSVAGGLENAFTQAAELDIDTFQIFTRNQRQWKAKPIADDEQKKFRAALKASKVKSTRIGYCFDTCHAYVSGYDIRTEEGIAVTMEHFDNILDLKNLKVFHLNDSKGDLGSHLDRHEHIGKGKLTLTPFRYIMQNF